MRIVAALAYLHCACSEEISPPTSPPPSPPASPPPGSIYPGGISVDVLGQSGKMTLSNGPNSVTVAMDSIYELDATGNIIGNTGPNAGKHSVQTFVSQDFAIDASPRHTDEYGVPASAIDFSTTMISGSSKLAVSTMIFQYDGTITPTPTESWAVAGGSIKFSINVSSWSFCSGQGGTPCSGATGDFLQLDLEIKGSGGSSATPSGPKRFNLATNTETSSAITLELSDQVLLDGSWVQMPAGYPKIVMQGSKQLFQFRLPRFLSTAYYDPIVNGMGVTESKFPTEIVVGAGIGAIVGAICLWYVYKRICGKKPKGNSMPMLNSIP